MKKLLCYLGILVLFVLAFLPLTLRIFLPDEGEKEAQEVVIESIVLSCNSDKYRTSTSYKNDKIQMIVIKRIKENSQVSDVESQDDENLDNNEITPDDTKSELDIIFNSLTTANNITYNVLEDGEVIGIDFSIYDHANLDLTKLKNEPELQKNYYESQGLTCSIRK